jgi:hypothetical protein
MITTIILITIIEGISAKIYALPKCTTPEEVRAVMSNMPVGAYIMVLMGCAIGCVGGAVVATYISGRTNYLYAILVGASATLASIINSIQVPGQPTWFIILNILICLPFAYIGYLAAAKPE